MSSDERVHLLAMTRSRSLPAAPGARPHLTILPMGFGYIEGVTHDYQRHGTTTLFVAVNVLDGASPIRSEVDLKMLADAVGITFQQVQKCEKGTNRVSAGVPYSSCARAG